MTPGGVTYNRGLTVSIYCRVVLNPAATAGQISAVGAALWDWCVSASAGRVYRYLDNQGLTDVIAGRLPGADPAALPPDRWDVRFGVRDGAFADRRAALESLREALPAAAVQAVRVEGVE